MTQRLFILDVPEHQDIVQTARGLTNVTVSTVGPYFVLEAAERLSIDRRSTGVRHAVWYSCIAGLEGYGIVQWDKDALVLEAR
ncbi:hypothetical protein [Nocardioides panzhihuensis]|uniref:Uncharacterized protein n=1 Tax=Nocardioides panzhihuensis TaxID=860243 RepID=A0A7Z0DS21_9ACTN|nr:hypothetical protein [Nocardioides panzhihuensis]NYI80397.1 hypothetical protein [Nocardioides panzhihuensis]